MKNIRTRLAIALAAACLCGCAAYGVAGAEPVPIGNDVYTIGSGSATSVDDAGYQRAIRFCFEQGKQLLRLDGQTGLPRSESGGITFRCVGPGEPGWKEPVG
jgi:hypothetical protein